MYKYRQLTAEQKAEVVQQRLARGYPPHSPPHPVRDRPYYLLTAACYEHQAHMAQAERRQVVLDMLLNEFIQAGQEIMAWVILPNHYHLLVHVTEFDRLGKLLRAVHGPTSYQWNLEDHTTGRKTWYRYTDRAIRSERHYYTTLNYIHYNPVKHHYVDSPYDWPESSVHWYLAHHGRDWLRELWASYPLKSYGDKWDD